ncbi:hypothetical protein PO878_17335 [Iamia majanohamensis]|uniref:Uncharacterized protein n=1 Tax=Iamia majanohamensis TaxID=467976 RepID=A0AAE9Y4N9_9ACTN|nr:hypothetical protein [Iamia majanohamensis]WCO66267.1 hypothetical protein PO878_17335 [Iamia majanohamensis]
MTTIDDLVVGDGKRSGAADGSGGDERVSADHVDGHDAVAGQVGLSSSDGERGQRPIGSVEAHHDD